MFFLQPIALLGLAAALVPPLLHLFQRRRPPDVVFPAVRYLRQTERDAERSIRLRHLLLMILRMLAVATLVTAAARPVVPGGVAGGGLHEPTALVLVLDHSLSSGAIAGGARVQDDLEARARETLRAAQLGDAVWVIGADGLARRGTPGELLPVVSSVRPEARRLDLAAAVGTAARLIATSGYARGEIHVLSDLQRSAFEGDAGEGSREPYGSNSSAAGVPILFYAPAAAPPENRAVVSAEPRPPVWLAGTGGVAVRVGGGPAPAGRAAVSLTLAGRGGGRALAAPGEEVVLSAPATQPGWKTGEALVEADELRADDRRPFAVRVVAPATVVVASSADLGRFATEALAVLESAGQIRRPGAGASGGAGAAAVVHLGDAPRGFAAVLLPPADPIALGATNRALAAAGTGWRFGERVEREDTVASTEVPEASGARVHRRYRLEAQRPDAERGVLARAGRDPWLVRDGQVVIIASRLVPEETELPLAPAFVPFLGALFNRVARGEAGTLEAAPGDVVAMPARVTAIALGGDSTLPVEAGERVPAPAAPGVYALLSGDDTTSMLVVAPDPRESDLARADAWFLRARFPGAAVRLVSDPRQYAALRFRGAGRSELTGWLLVATLTLLVVEAGVATGGLRRAAG